MIQNPVETSHCFWDRSRMMLIGMLGWVKQKLTWFDTFDPRRSFTTTETGTVMLWPNRKYIFKHHIKHLSTLIYLIRHIKETADSWNHLALFSAKIYSLTQTRPPLSFTHMQTRSSVCLRSESMTPTRSRSTHSLLLTYHSLEHFLWESDSCYLWPPMSLLQK